MELPDVVSTLQQAAPGARVEEARAADGASTLYVHPDDLGPVLVALKDHPSLAFTLFELTAIDYLPREPRFELVYQLVSIAHKTRLRVKVRVPGTDPHVATASSIWPSANWLEREVWDLFGIAFDGHPDPRRLLMPEDWEGFPLRKDFPVQIRMTPKTGEAIQVTAEEFRENLQRDRLSRQQ